MSAEPALDALRAADVRLLSGWLARQVRRAAADGYRTK